MAELEVFSLDSAKTRQVTLLSLRFASFYDIIVQNLTRIQGLITKFLSTSLQSRDISYKSLPENRSAAKIVVVQALIVSTFQLKTLISHVSQLDLGKDFFLPASLSIFSWLAQKLNRPKKQREVKEKRSRQRNKKFKLGNLSDCSTPPTR